MIERIIEVCAKNRFLVFTIVLLVTLGGVYAAGNIPLDAVPDISDVQVIIYTKWEGRSPDLVEDQVTYPIVTALVSAPRVKTVRGFSDFGFSYIYVIFEDGTDIYWARSRVLEYMQQITGQLPPGVTPTLGPDATGVGWVFTYALVDETGQHDLADLRTLQDWYLRYALASVEGVAEVASVGGFVKQYQVNLDPNRISAYGLSLQEIVARVSASNRDVEGRLLEFGGREYMVRGRGYIKNVSDIEKIALGTNRRGTPILLRDVAQVTMGPEIRRGIVELNGKGEVVGGIVVMRFGENALNVIQRVKAKIDEITPGLPKGIQIVPTYDRSELIALSIQNLQKTLLTEIIVVSLVIIVFLLHFRSALVPIFALPIAMILSFIPMYFLKLTSNIMSLGGIALSIGVMVDASIVMVENGYRHLAESTTQERKKSFSIIVRACQQVGRGIFFALLIIIISFIPVFLLEAQEGRMFRPLAFTKTFAMAASSILAITFVPVLLTIFLKGKRLRPETENPVCSFFRKFYEPAIHWVLRYKKTTLFLAFLVMPLSVPVFFRVGSEFMPPLYEGTIFYMPITNPGISVTEAGRLLAIQDKILKSFPEVHRVFGKAGRAETSTDPAPFSMMETVVQLKPREEWRKIQRDYSWIPEWMRPIVGKILGTHRTITYEELVAEMDQRMKFPGLQNAWTMPIRARIDMLSTGIRTPVGIKISGSDLHTIQELGIHIEMILKEIAGTRSVYAEKVTGGYFTDIKINRHEIARYGLTVGDVQDVIQTALGGMNVSRTIEGRERYPVTIRYQRELRDDLEKIKRILVPVRMVGANEKGAMGGPKESVSPITDVPLAQLADIVLTEGPAMIRNEDAMLTGYVYVDVAGRDIGGYVKEAKRLIGEKLRIPPGYSLSWSGQYEFQLRAEERLKIVLPIVFFIIFILLYVTFQSALESIMVMVTVLYAMTGGLILQYFLGFNFSVAVWVGYIALYGLAVETGVVMVIYLKEALNQRLAKGEVTPRDIHEAVVEGSVLRLRPKLMTVGTTLIALIPIMGSTGVGADVMKPIAAPIIGGLVTSTIQVLIIMPVIFAMMKERALRKGKLKPGHTE